VQWLVALGMPLAVAACVAHRPIPGSPHYVLGSPYQAGGVWYYPSASYNAEATGLAMVTGRNHASLTANGEVFDPGALAAAHQTLQLPAIVQITNLDNGLQLTVRVNDRGPAQPNRLVAVTPRVAELLRFPASGVAPVRVAVLSAESHDAVDSLGGAPEDHLALTTAPRDAVVSSDLPPPGVRAAPVAREPAAPVLTDPGGAATPRASSLLRLPEQLVQGQPEAGSLWVQLGEFSRYEFAARQRGRVAGLDPTIERFRIGRQETYRVQIGPLATIADADSTLDQVIHAGMTDARIVVR
jgi:rare lipoprotein A